MMSNQAAFISVRVIDYIPFGKASYKEKIGIHANPYDVKEAHEQYQKDRQAMKDWSQRQPTHYEYLRDNIYV